jgi:DNA recombination protein RmuC
MDDWMVWLTGIALGCAAATVLFLFRRNAYQARLADARTRAEVQDAQLQDRDDAIERLRGDLEDTRTDGETARRDVAALREQLRLRDEQLADQRRTLEDARTKLSETFTTLSTQVLHANSEQFMKLAKSTFDTYVTEARGDVDKRRVAIEELLKPIRASLDKHADAVGKIERKREVAYKSLEEQIRSIATGNERLNAETNRLVTALRKPEQRGRWGEMQLRNAVELAGMTEHCDFHEQPPTDDPETRDRPDMTVDMPGGGVIVVDSKVALDAYLTALEPDADRDAELARHAAQVEKHYKSLAGKQYWKQFERTPKLVVMFMPLESALVAALERKPDLHAAAMKNNVLIATPTLLIALLRAVAYGWQQEDIAANAREIARTGADLYDRLAKFTEHFEKVGASLNRATRVYNDAIGSLDRRLLPTARELKRLHATTAADIPPPPAVTVELRQIASDELRIEPSTTQSLLEGHEAPER